MGVYDSYVCATYFLEAKDQARGRKTNDPVMKAISEQGESTRRWSQTDDRIRLAISVRVISIAYFSKKVFGNANGSMSRSPRSPALFLFRFRWMRVTRDRVKDRNDVSQVSKRNDESGPRYWLVRVLN